MTLTTATAIAAACVLIAYTGYKWLLPKPLPGIPYNEEAARSLLGDIPSLLREMSKTGDLVKWILDQNLRSGVAMCQLFMHPLGKPVVVIADYREAYDIHMHRHKEFDRSDDISAVFNGIVEDSMFPLKTGAKWRASRKLMHDTMLPAFLNNVAAPNIYASSLRFVDLWNTKAELADGRPFSAPEDFNHATLDAVLAFSFGSQFPHSATKPQLQMLNGLSAKDVASGTSKDDPARFPKVEIHQDIDSLGKLVEALGRVQSSPTPRMKWWIVKPTRYFQKWSRIKDNCLRVEIEKAVNSRNENSADLDGSWVRSAVDHIIDREDKQAQKEARKPDFFSSSFMNELYGFVVAGHDSTSTTMSWASKLLADNPTTQSQLRDALRAGYSAAFSEKRVPTIEEITGISIPLLDATIEEILRLANAVPMGVRQATRETTVLGRRIPKGTIVMCLHNGPSMLTPAYQVDESRRSERSQEEREKGRHHAWSDDDGGLFKPTRWLAEAKVDEKAGSEKGSSGKPELVFDKHAGPSLPFGGGPRGCFGKRLAYIQLRILLVMLIWNFELEKCPEHLSSYGGYLAVVYKPRQCFVRLRKVSYKG